MKRYNIKPLDYHSDIDVSESTAGEWVKYEDIPKWIPVSERLPEKGQFLAYWETRSPLMLVCFAAPHKDYIQNFSNGNDTAWHGEHPKFTHWSELMELPGIPTQQVVSSNTEHTTDVKD